ncbi:protein kinase domain-containing protein [Sorangium sp. So ce887]|uniref:protein kinase domain-containing protein n=1 Tax=Sorangium sp. So ce887 TaxID=3133324 RepID=UPI003F5EE203
MKRRSQDDEVSEARAGQAPPAAAGRNRPPLLDPGTWFLRRFRVERLLGQGGMGAVYAVADKGQIWALKIVRSEFLDDPDQRRRLLREGEVLSRMRHPNVVQVHEVAAPLAAPGGVSSAAAGASPPPESSAGPGPLPPEVF